MRGILQRAEIHSSQEGIKGSLHVFLGGARARHDRYVSLLERDLRYE